MPDGEIGTASPVFVDVDQLEAAIAKANKELKAAAHRETLLRSELSEAVGQQRVLATQCADAVKRRDAETERREAIASRLEETRAKENAMRAELAEAKRAEGEARAAAVREELAKEGLQARLGTDVGDTALAEARQRISSLQARVEDLSLSRDELATKCGAVTEESAHREQQLSREHEATEVLRRSLANAEARITELLEAEHKRNLEVAQLEAQALDAKWKSEDVEHAGKEAQDLRARVHALEAERDHLTATMDELRRHAAKHPTAELQRQDDGGALERDLVVAQTVIETLEDQCEASERWIKTYRTRIAELNEKNGHLSRQLTGVLLRIGQPLQDDGPALILPELDPVGPGLEQA